MADDENYSVNDKWANETFDVGSEGIEDLKLNPDYYIHTALLKAQESLLNTNIKDGFAQYRIFIEHIETLARSSGLLIPEYDTKITEFQDSDQYKGETDSFNKSVMLANKKLFLIMNSVFKKKTVTDSVKF